MTINRYFDYVLSKLNDSKNENENIENASNIIVDKLSNDGKLFVFGSGHSHMIAEELYLRAGGLALVHPILEEEFMLHGTLFKSSEVERLEGYGNQLLKLHGLSEKDVLLLISNSGRNNVIVDMALYAKEIKVPVIALTSIEHSSSVFSRHASNKKLSDLADVVIDNHAPMGDAGFEIENLKETVGGVSDIIGLFLSQTLIVNVTDKLTQLNLNPPVFRSSNLDNADEYNLEIIRKHYNHKG